jgi:hypothetical protein
MKVKTFTLLLLTITFMACACSAKATIITDSNREYSFEEYGPETGDLYLSCGSFYSVNADTLRSYSEKTYSEHVPVPADAREAAQTGASILDIEYDNWSEAKSVLVHFNKEANAWIVHGQLTDRYSDDSIGVIAIEAATGEVLCIVCNK